MTAATAADRHLDRLPRRIVAPAPATLAAGPQGPTLPEDLVDVIRRHLLLQDGDGRAFFCLALSSRGHWTRSCASTLFARGHHELGPRMAETIRKASLSMIVWRYIGEEAHRSYQRNIMVQLAGETASRAQPQAEPAALPRMPAFARKFAVLEAAASAEDEKTRLQTLAGAAVNPAPSSRRPWAGTARFFRFLARREGARQSREHVAALCIEVEERLAALHREVEIFYPLDQNISF